MAAITTTNDTVRTVQIGLKQLQSQEQLNEWEFSWLVL